MRLEAMFTEGELPETQCGKGDPRVSPSNEPPRG